jgi:hypothetical protein
VSRGYRVQATWTVNGESRSYTPLFFKEQAEADEAAEEMRRTLAHFPTLVVQVVAVDHARVLETAAGQLGSQTSDELHVAEGPRGGLTLCGASTDGLNSVALELFTDTALYPTVPQSVCRTCRERAGR